jgi:hypothetical protein
MIQRLYTTGIRIYMPGILLRARRRNSPIYNPGHRRQSSAATGGRQFGPTRGNRTEELTASTVQEQWLRNDQLQYFQVLKERKIKKDAADNYNKNLPKPKELRTIQLGERSLQGLSISPSGRFINYRLTRSARMQKLLLFPCMLQKQVLRPIP